MALTPPGKIKGDGSWGGESWLWVVWEVGGHFSKWGRLAFVVGTVPPAN